MRNRLPRFPAACALAASLTFLPASLSANTSHHSVGGGTSGGSIEGADCLRWETVYLSADGAVLDGPPPDGATPEDAGDAAAPASDAGTAPVAVTMRCVEHVTLFGCDCSTGAGRGADGAPPATVVFAALALGAAVVRRRRRAGAGATRS